jgi:hypothetical protein
MRRKAKEQGRQGAYAACERGATPARRESGGSKHKSAYIHEGGGTFVITVGGIEIQNGFVVLSKSTACTRRYCVYWWDVCVYWWDVCVYWWDVCVHWWDVCVYWWDVCVYWWDV